MKTFAYMLDYSKDGSIVGIETPDASKYMTQPSKFEYEIA